MDFNELWADSHVDVVESQPDTHRETPEYQLKDGIMRYELMSDIFLKYFHVVHGTPEESPDLESVREFKL